MITRSFTLYQYRRTIGQNRSKPNTNVFVSIVFYCVNVRVMIYARGTYPGTCFETKKKREYNRGFDFPLTNHYRCFRSKSRTRFVHERNKSKCGHELVFRWAHLIVTAERRTSQIIIYVCNRFARALFFDRDENGTISLSNVVGPIRLSYETVVCAGVENVFKSHFYAPRRRP